MLPISLLAEDIVRSDGVGPPININRVHGKLLVVTLGITRIIEQESLEVAVYGSPDGVQWDEKPLGSFPQKFYCGLYSTLLNLSAHPDVEFIRVRWKASRWNRPGSTPLFSFFVEAEESGSRIQSAGATVHAAIA